MEDLVDSEQGDQFVGVSADEAALAIEQAVALHAPRWGDPTLRDLAAFSTFGDDVGERLGLYYDLTLEGFLDRLGARLDDDVVQLTRDFAEVIRRWPEASTTAKTVVHGDFRPDNFLFGRTPQAPPLVVVDWQTVSLALGVADLAYLLGNGFHPDERSVVESDLVEDYRRRLVAAGIDYGRDDCWRDYRLGALHGVVISVIATVVAEQTERGDEMLTLMASHHGRHALQLESLALLA
jgi:aminoglycoside phosphotransferase (APT) family kinase protein